MSACARFREALLEADADVLAGRGGTELAAHVRECAGCAGATGAILDATARLGEALDVPGRPVDVDAILARARRRETTPHRRIPARAWVALAAAAAAGLMVMGRREPARLPSTPSPVAAPPLVEPSGVAAVAVIPTRSPDITILWFFEGG